MTTHTPTKKQFNTVIAHLQSVQPAADRLIALHGRDISMMNVGVDHSCGTPMCHGGWYAVAKKISAHGYKTGAQHIALDLGFENIESLLIWANLNHHLWGNIHGTGMFSSNYAFNLTPEETISLKAIITHWKHVRDRCHPTLFSRILTRLTSK